MFSPCCFSESSFWPKRWHLLQGAWFRNLISSVHKYALNFYLSNYPISESEPLSLSILEFHLRSSTQIGIMNPYISHIVFFPSTTLIKEKGNWSEHTRMYVRTVHEVFGVRLYLALLPHRGKVQFPDGLPPCGVCMFPACTLASSRSPKTSLIG